MNEYGLDFNTLYGGQSGEGSSQDIMTYLFTLLQESGREQWEYKDKANDPSEEYDWMGMGQLGWQGANRPAKANEPWSNVTPGLNLGEWENYLSYGLSDEGGYWKDYEAGNPSRQRAQDLLSILQGSGLKDLTAGYGQDMGDIGSEIGVQIEGLQEGYGRKSKKGRYGSLGTGGRNIKKGGRSQLLSDVYGLQQRQYEMQQDLRDQFTDDFYGNIATWQGLNPSPYIEE